MKLGGRDIRRQEEGGGEGGTDMEGGWMKGRVQNGGGWESGTERTGVTKGARSGVGRKG